MDTLFNNNGTQARIASLLGGTPARFVSQLVILMGMSDSVKGELVPVSSRESDA